MEPVSIQIESSPGTFTAYLVTERKAPTIDQLPWNVEESDAFVVVLDGELLSDELAAEIAESLVKLPVDWIEIIGPRTEYLHDLIDEASVAIGRQPKVGDGNPMTAWHQFSDLYETVSYLRVGGLGATERKIVVVIGIACRSLPDNLNRHRRQFTPADVQLDVMQSRTDFFR